MGSPHGPAGNGRGQETAKIAALVLLLALLLPGLRAVPLSPGQYTDYTWESDYRPAAAPAPVPLNCAFFVSDATLCQSISSVSGSAGEAVLLATIRQGSPEDNQDAVRRWDSGLPIGAYYENVSQGVGNQSAPGMAPPDGAWGENGSLRNMWFRLLELYPSVYDERDGYYYVNDQTLMQTNVRLSFVVPNPQNGTWCAQSYNIKGYDTVLTKSLGEYSTTGRVLPVSQLMAEGQKANLTLTMSAKGDYQYSLSALAYPNGTFANLSNGSVSNATLSCQAQVSNHTQDTLTLAQNYPIKRYPDTFQYDHVVSIPPSGFAQGLVRLSLPSDFLSYTVSVKGYSYTISRNDIRLARRGVLDPLLQLQLIPAPGRSGTLHITGLQESDQDGRYIAELRYQLPVETPDLGEGDCAFRLATPFEVKRLDSACQTARSQGRIALSIVKTQDGAGLLAAHVTDPLGNPQQGIDVLFASGSEQWQTPTNAEGLAQVWIPQTAALRQVEASIAGSQDVGQARAMIFLPGLGQYAPGEKSLTEGVWAQAPILLILLLVASLMIWLVRRRSSAVLVLILALAMLLPFAHAQDFSGYNASGTGLVDLQSTIQACQNYDFDNAVRHFGECAQSYQMANEFAAMRSTATVIIANIAPLVVATPDITPYKSAYQNMVLIALALFRVAWAFNSLYLILNIFNPSKRNEALKQYIWLIVFVIFAYFSFSIIREGINAVNSISTWIAGTDAASTLTQAGLSAQFVAENYEMLKLVLPFLNVTYLVLLARYVSVIAMMLFFPFSLLLFFTSATRGFGRAALTVTFAGLGLGVINAILLLIYSILVKTTDPALSGTFAATFFSASFIIFFGFVNLLVLSVAFLSGIVFIGQTRGSEA
ncbi:Uncharacterised protein [uncultured archaeon]|nr:Uncharacterised protein [uncultured archaeon]